MQFHSVHENPPIEFLLIGDDSDLDILREPIGNLWCQIDFEHHRTVGATIDKYGKASRRPPGRQPDCIVMGSHDPCALKCKSLRRVRTQTILKFNPIIILTDGEDIRDIDTYLNAGANYAVRRDQVAQESGEIVNIVTDFWLKGPDEAWP